MNPNDENKATPTGSKSIVIYFSRTNNTERIARFIIEETGSESYEILAKVPYTDEDINYNDSNSRANKEQNDSTATPLTSPKHSRQRMLQSPQVMKEFIPDS